MNNKVINFFGSHKKSVAIVVILLLLLPIILPMPMRCFEVHTTQPPAGGGEGYLAGDVGTVTRNLECYSFMREEFRANKLVRLPPDYVGESHIGFEWMFFSKLNKYAAYLIKEIQNISMRLRIRVVSGA